MQSPNKYAKDKNKTPYIPTTTVDTVVLDRINQRFTVQSLELQRIEKNLYNVDEYKALLYRTQETCDKVMKELSNIRVEFQEIKDIFEELRDFKLMLDASKSWKEHVTEESWRKTWAEQVAIEDKAIEESQVFI